MYYRVLDVLKFICEKDNNLGNYWVFVLYVV